MQDLNLSDDFLFAKVMESKEACKAIIEKILNVKIKRIKFLDSQVVHNVGYASKSIRMDIYLDDENGNVFTVEMQKLNEYNIPRRARYYHAVNDVDVLLEGMKYSELKENYVIFICLFDPFDADRHYYSFRNTCEEDKSLHLNDGSHTLILSTRGTTEDIDDELKNFLRYVENSTYKIVEDSGSPLLKMIHSQVLSIKHNSAQEVEYMKYEENLARAEAKGHKSGKLDDARKMLERKMSMQDIIDITGLNEADIRELRSEETGNSN